MKSTLKQTHLITLVIALLILITSQLNLYSQWIPTYGPGGGRITKVLNYNNKVYAGTSYGQVYVSNNNTETWNDITNNLPPSNYDVRSLACNSTGTYVLINDSVYFLPASATSWVTLQTGISGLYTLYADGNNIFAGTQNGKIYFSANGGNSWEERSTGITPGVSVNTMIVNNNYLFAGCSNGIFRTSNNGIQWENAIYSGWIYALNFKGDTLLSNYNGGINYSTDFGTTWQYIPTGTQQGGAWIFSLASYGSTIAAGAFYGVYISHDNGVTWNFNNMGNGKSMQVEALLFSGSRLLSGSNAGIYVSDDLGNNWKSNMYGLTSLRTNRLIKSGNDLYANLVMNGGGIQLSTNNGNNWAPVSNSYMPSWIEQMISVNNIVFAATADGIFKTTNKGTTWTEVNNGMDSNEIVYALEYSNGKLFAGSQNNGIFMSTDLGDSWNNISAGLPSKYVRTIALKGNLIFAGTYLGMYFSSDFGITWEPRKNGLPDTWIMRVQSYHGRLYTITESYGLYVSTDDGLSWAEMSNGLPDYTYFLSFTGRNIFACSDAGVYMSTNLGSSWQAINTGFPSSQYEVYRVLIKDYYIYAGTALSGVWKRPLREVLPSYTVSGQVRYKNNNQPVNSGKVRALKYDEESGNIITVDSAVIQPGGLYLMPHVPGDSLFIMSYPDDEFDFAPTYYPSSIDWREATQIYPSGNLSNVDISVEKLNNTANPYSISGGVYKTANLSVGISNAFIYAKSGNEYKNFGVSNNEGFYNIGNLAPGTYDLTCYRIGYNSLIKPVSIVNVSLQSVNFNLTGYLIGVEPPYPPFPDKYILNQNYPNPFNPVTNIKISIPVNSHTKLVIYDILGREVAVLVNEVLQAGVYNFKWDGKYYSSGVYFYRLQANDFTETKKMVLTK